MYLYTLNLLQCNPFTAMSFFFSIITDRVDLHLDIHLQLFILADAFLKVSCKSQHEHIHICLYSLQIAHCLDSDDIWQDVE